MLVFAGNPGPPPDESMVPVIVALLYERFERCGTPPIIAARVALQIVVQSLVAEELIDWVDERIRDRLIAIDDLLQTMRRHERLQRRLNSVASYAMLVTAVTWTLISIIPQLLRYLF